MSILKYEVFVAVTELENFTKVAEKLNMTQSAVSRSIKSLEDFYGSELFTRNKDGVKLNKFGELVLPEMKNVLSANRKLENIVNDYNDIQVGKLVVGSFSSASTLLLPDIIADFNFRFPNIQIEVKEGHYDEIQKYLNNDIVDLALLIEEFLEPDYSTHHMFTDKIKLIVPKQYKLDVNIPVAIKQIEEHPFIVTEHYPNPYLNKLFDKYNLQPNTQYVLRTNQTVFAFVEKGLGIALMPESTVLRTDFKFDVIGLEESIHRKIYLATKQKNLKIPMIESFWNTAKVKNPLMLE